MRPPVLLWAALAACDLAAFAFGPRRGKCCQRPLVSQANLSSAWLANWCTAVLPLPAGCCATKRP